MGIEQKSNIVKILPPGPARLCRMKFAPGVQQVLWDGREYLADEFLGNGVNIGHVPEDARFQLVKIGFSSVTDEGQAQEREVTALEPKDEKEKAAEAPKAERKKTRKWQG